MTGATTSAGFVLVPAAAAGETLAFGAIGCPGRNLGWDAVADGDAAGSGGLAERSGSPGLRRTGGVVGEVSVTGALDGAGDVVAGVSIGGGAADCATVGEANGVVTSRVGLCRSSA
jgi:hypothetical protein